MCHYISLVTSGLEVHQVDSVLRHNGRRARSTQIKTLQNAMHEGEKQFITCVGDCDCGTVLAKTAATPEIDSIAQIDKLLAKGWTRQKAERSVKAKLESESNKPSKSIDSQEVWQKIISELLAIKGCKEAGLMLHFYSGAISDEKFVCIRKPIKITSMNKELLKLPQDDLLMVSM